MSEKKFKKYYQDFCGLLLFLAITLSMAEIVCRVSLGISSALLFHGTVWITVWAILLIVGVILPEGAHVSIDFIRFKLKDKARWILELFLAFMNLVYSGLITFSAILYMQQLYSRGAVFVLQISVPMWIVILCVPIGMGIFSIFAVLVLIKVVRGQ